MRVLHAIPSLVEASGGPTTALVGLASAQARRGHAVTVVTTLRADEVVAEAESLSRAGVDVVAIGPCSVPFSSHAELPALIDRLAQKADIVHTHGVWEDIQYRCSVTCQRLRIPYIMRTCGSLDAWSLRVKPVRKLLYRTWRLDAMLRHAAAIHCTTEWERESTANVTPKANFIIEPNGVLLDDFRILPDPPLFRSRLGLDGRPVIGYLGRIHPGKGLEYLVPALAALQKRDAVLVAAGPDSHGYRRVVESLAETHGVRERVFFPGMLRGKAKVDMLCSTNLFVMASHHENFGIAVAEAMAAGCAVIVSDHVGIKSDIEKAACGAVVPLDVPQIAVAMDAWLTEESRCRAAGKRGRAFALTEYDWDEIAVRWQGHYESLLSRS